MAWRTQSVATIAVGTVFVAAVALLIYSSAQSESDSAPRGSATVPVAASDQDAQPLPDEVTRVEQVVDLARRQAKRWRDDAHLIRLYATDVRADGSFDRGSSVVQVVFVSPEASRAGNVVNGWRLSVRAGMYGAVEIWQYPAPEIDPRPFRWCPLPELVGEGAPERFMLDIHYTKQEKKEPMALAFTRAPKRWLAGADPFTCEVRDRSRPRTVEEDRELDAGSAEGAMFDVKTANDRVFKAVSSSKCHRGDASGVRSTVQVAFGKDGKAESVKFLAGHLDGTAEGRCLEKELLRLRVDPWERGEGTSAARFVW